jgi:NAD(P)-dependent dehydrogenase (short-subunit alcohol dehydrogenase family)
MADLADKVILITGGGSGLGEGVAIAAAAEGARVAVLDYDDVGAKRVAAAIEGARAYQVNVTDLEAVKRVTAQVVNDFGKLDGAVNSAGISGPLSSLSDTSIDHWNSVIAVNLTGVFFSIQTQIPHMLANGSGSIVNISSMAGILGEPRLAAYTASKHGVVGLTKVTALEFARQGIRCNAVCPSFVRTPMVMKETPEEMWPMMAEMHPIGRVLTVEEVANTCIFLLSEKSSGITGSNHLVDGGAAAR